jgi:hypothetical protein
MTSSALLQPADYVWLPEADAGGPEPPPPGADDILAVHLGRHAGTEATTRTVLVETSMGFAPLERRIRLHGDVDEGWDWGWRGSAPLETALNLLTCFVHAKAAWRLQWAFCEAFLHPLPPAGGTLCGERIRAWLREHGWIGRQRTWTGAPEAAERAALAAERARSRALSPRDRAARMARLLATALGWKLPARAGADPDPDVADSGSAAALLERAAAVLAGSPAGQRWATVALLARHLPSAGSPAREAWRREASPRTPGLPDPDTVVQIATVWSRLVGRPARERAALLSGTIREQAERGAPSWTAVPSLALPLGGGCSAALRGELHLAGDPAAVAATLHALRTALLEDHALAAQATVLGLTPGVLSELIGSAHRLHVLTLRQERQAIEARAAEEAARVQTAEAVRLARGRGRRPPPHSTVLRRWLLSISEDLLIELARAARGPAGALTLRAAMRGAGVSFPDPAGTVAQAVAWYLEERVPRVLDMPTFLVRGDGLFRTPAAPDRKPPANVPFRTGAVQPRTAAREIAEEMEHALRSVHGRAPRAA